MAVVEIGVASKESIETLKKAINEILYSGVDEKTKRVALEVLSKGVASPHMNLSGCNIYGGSLGDE